MLRKMRRFVDDEHERADNAKYERQSIQADEQERERKRRDNERAQIICLILGDFMHRFDNAHDCNRLAHKIMHRN